MECEKHDEKSETKSLKTQFSGNNWVFFSSGMTKASTLIREKQFLKCSTCK